MVVLTRFAPFLFLFLVVSAMKKRLEREAMEEGED